MTLTAVTVLGMDCMPRSYRLLSGIVVSLLLYHSPPPAAARLHHGHRRVRDHRHDGLVEAMPTSTRRWTSTCAVVVNCGVLLRARRCSPAKHPVKDAALDGLGGIGAGFTSRARPHVGRH